MEWICFIFKKNETIYLVPDDSVVSAWKNLSIRQSMSIDNCKNQYEYIGFLNQYSLIKKIKI